MREMLLCLLADFVDDISPGHEDHLDHGKWVVAENSLLQHLLP